MGTSLGGPQSFDQQQQQQSSYDQEAFARSREMAQTDPDYARRGSASAQGSSGIDNKELFQPSLARKSFSNNNKYILSKVHSECLQQIIQQVLL